VQLAAEDGSPSLGSPFRTVSSASGSGAASGTESAGLGVLPAARQA
jgi:hypothetical protein